MEYCQELDVAAFEEFTALLWKLRGRHGAFEKLRWEFGGRVSGAVAVFLPPRLGWIAFGLSAYGSRGCAALQALHRASASKAGSDFVRLTVRLDAAPSKQ
jgi:hypothetical protein